MGSQGLRLALCCIALLAPFVPSNAKAGEPVPPQSERLTVEGLKKKYAERETTELRVVQAPVYTKKRRFEFGVFGGTVIADPFLSVKSAGGTIAFHITDNWGIFALGFHDFVSSSNALTTIQSYGYSANTDPPRTFLGGGIEFSPLYGKLSLIGKSIFYYDLHVAGGVGETVTQTGNDLTPFIGAGQMFYLSKYFALKIDYRLMAYKEVVLDQIDPAPLRGTVVRKDTRYTDTISLGISFLL